MITKYFVHCLLFIPLSILSAQNEKIPNFEYGACSDKELKMHRSEIDTSADAVILGHVGNLTMGNDYGGYYGYTLIVRKRIKIFKNSAFGQANIKIPYSGNILEIKAQTISPSGEKYALTSKDFFRENQMGNLEVLKFAFPKITEGAIIEYEYKRVSLNTFNLTDWYFQHTLPTEFSVLNLEILPNFEYKYLFQGDKNLKSTEVKNDKKTGYNKLSLYVNNLKALKEEAFITTLDNYRTRVQFLRTKFYNTSSILKDDTYNDWSKIENELLFEKGAGRKYLDKYNYIELTAASKKVYNTTDPARAKILKLYNWINKNIECGNMYGFSSDIMPNNVWRKKKARTYSDLNFALIAALREAGLEANPVFISTRSNGQHITEIPALDQFNHIVIAIEMPKNQRIFLEAGFDYLPIGLLHTESLNYTGWLLRKGDCKWLDIKPAASSEILMAKLNLSEEGTLKGILSTSFKGYAAQKNRASYKGDLTGKSRIEDWRKKYKDWQIDSIITTQFHNLDEPLREKVYLNIANAAQISNDLILLKPTLKSGWEANPFKIENRDYSVELPYPTNDQYTLSLSIPKGYIVDELPQSINISLPPDDAKFVYQITHDIPSNSINLLIKIQVNKVFFSVENYTYLRNFFSQIASKLEEVIVLKKSK